MTRLRIRTPSRLHFGLLGWGHDAPRQFGGAGLMIDDPGIVLTAEPAGDWRAEGPLAERALEIARRVAGRLAAGGSPPAPLRIRVEQAPEEHVGLGVGTQLSLAVGRILLASAGLPEPSIASLAALSGRGLRSGIGLHGFAHGGLIVDGGRRGAEGIPPLLAHLPVPAAWSILVVLPDRRGGLHGPEELEAFAKLPPMPQAMTERLCRLVLLGLLPAVVEQDLPAFGAALSEIQQEVGRGFSSAQGGVFAHPRLNQIAAVLRAQGLRGVGQSSWGPTLYAFSDEPADRRQEILGEIRGRLGLEPHAAFWTSTSQAGAVLERT